MEWTEIILLAMCTAACLMVFDRIDKYLFQKFFINTVAGMKTKKNIVIELQLNDGPMYLTFDTLKEYRKFIDSNVEVYKSLDNQSDY